MKYARGRGICIGYIVEKDGKREEKCLRDTKIPHGKAHALVVQENCLVRPRLYTIKPKHETCQLKANILTVPPLLIISVINPLIRVFGVIQELLHRTTNVK